MALATSFLLASNPSCFGPSHGPGSSAALKELGFCFAASLVTSVCCPLFKHVLTSAFISIVRIAALLCCPASSGLLQHIFAAQFRLDSCGRFCRLTGFVLQQLLLPSFVCICLQHILLPSFVWTFTAHLCRPASSGSSCSTSLLPSIVWFAIS